MVAPTRPTATVRTQVDIIISQVEALERYRRFRSQQLDSRLASSRELRMEDERRRQVLAREKAALQARVEEQMAAPLGPLRLAVPPRVVVAHRNAWFVTRLTESLKAVGVRVVATTANGADAVGIVVAEHPDVLFMEAHLEMVPAEQVVQDLRQLCPQVSLLVQVESQRDVAEMLEAGASAVVTRRVSPSDVALELFGLVMPTADPLVPTDVVRQQR